MRQREKHVQQRQVKQIFIQTVDKFCKQKDCKIVEKINKFLSKKSLSISPKRNEILVKMDFSKNTEKKCLNNNIRMGNPPDNATLSW